MGPGRKAHRLRHAAVPRPSPESGGSGAPSHQASHHRGLAANSKSDFRRGRAPARPLFLFPSVMTIPPLPGDAPSPGRRSAAGSDRNPPVAARRHRRKTVAGGGFLPLVAVDRRREKRPTANSDENPLTATACRHWRKTIATSGSPSLPADFRRRWRIAAAASGFLSPLAHRCRCQRISVAAAQLPAFGHVGGGFKGNTDIHGQARTGTTNSRPPRLAASSLIVRDCPCTSVFWLFRAYPSSIRNERSPGLRVSTLYLRPAAFSAAKNPATASPISGTSNSSVG